MSLLRPKMSLIWIFYLIKWHWNALKYFQSSAFILRISINTAWRTWLQGFHGHAWTLCMVMHRHYYFTFSTGQSYNRRESLRELLCVVQLYNLNLCMIQISRRNVFVLSFHCLVLCVISAICVIRDCPALSNEVLKSTEKLNWSISFECFLCNYFEVNVIQQCNLLMI